MNELEMGTGAHESPYDVRTFQFSDLVTASEPLVKGGIIYTSNDILHQHKVGICTAISLVQHRQKVNGRKYSSDFQYLLQKRFYDFNLYEGSSIFHALKAGKAFGFLPLELWTHTTEEDRFLPYNEYISKIDALSAEEVTRLLLLCVDKLQGYAAVDTTDPQAIAKAINNSKGGIICMYGCGNTWWTARGGNTSWNPADINPLRKPESYTSGHAIINSGFDYSEDEMQVLVNTWGSTWNKQGQADINWSGYPMKEAWAILESPMLKPAYTFTKILRKGMKGADVIELQKALKRSGEYTYPTITGYFGTVTEKAVKAFQTRYAAEVLAPAKLYLATGIVGALTNKKLNGLGVNNNTATAVPASIITSMKTLVQSKTFWLAAAQLAIGIYGVVVAQYPAVETISGVIIIKSLVDMYLRSITSTPVSKII